MANSRLSVFPFSRLTHHGFGHAEACASRSFSVIARVLQLLQQRPEYRFTFETCSFLAAYVAQVPESLNPLREAVQEGRLDVGVLWTSTGQNACQDEALVRDLTRGLRFVRRLSGSPAGDLTVHLGDIPGLTPQFPQLAASCGLARVTVEGAGPRALSGFIWQSPDGSAVDVRWNPAGHSGIAGMSAGERRRMLANAAESGRRLFLGGLLALPSIEELDALQEAAVDHLEIDFATPFVAGDLPGGSQVLTGDLPSCVPGLEPLVPDIFGLSVSGAYSLSRAEQFTAISRWLCGEGGTDFSEEWAAYTCDYGDATESGNRWRRRVLQAGVQIEGHLSASERLLASRVRPPAGPAGTIPIVVFNARSWTVTDWVEADVTLFGETDPTDFRRYDPYRLVTSQGDAVPFQELAGRQLRTSELRIGFVAADVPGNGFATFYIVPHTAESDGRIPVQAPGMMAPEFPEPTFVVEDVEERVAEAYRGLRTGRRFRTAGYDLDVDETSGRVRVYDRRTGRAVVDGIRIEGIEESLAGGLRRYSPSGRAFEPDVDSVDLEESGEARATVVVAGRLLRSPFELRYRMYGSLDRIDVDLRLEWKDPKPVRVQMVFPLSIANPDFTYGIPFGFARMKDLMPGTAPLGEGAADVVMWARQREVAGWVAAEAGGGEALVIGSDRSGFEFTDTEIRSDVLRSCPDPSSYSYHRIWRRYPDSVSARYSIRSSDGDLDRTRAARDGRAIQLPLRAASVYDTISPKTLPDRLSFLTLEGEGLLVTAIKAADDGEGLILRAYEADGRPASGKLRAFTGIRSVREANLLEDPGDALDPDDIAFRPYQIRTFRIELEEAA